MICANPECRHDEKNHTPNGCGIVVMHGNIVGVLCSCMKFVKPKEKEIINVA